MSLHFNQAPGQPHKTLKDPQTGMRKMQDSAISPPRAASGPLYHLTNRLSPISLTSLPGLLPALQSVWPSGHSSNPKDSQLPGTELTCLGGGPWGCKEAGSPPGS